MIFNKTRKTVLASKVTACDTPWKRTLGLMFHAKLQKGEAFLFTFPRPRRVWIHMLFVFFPIDMVFLDDKGKIVHIVRSARPFQLRIVPPVPISALIELPENTIARTSTRAGDSLGIAAQPSGK